MNPFLILACGVVVVLGGILWLRWHPFLALVLGALGVALLTSNEALQRHADSKVARGEWTAAAAEKWVKKPAPARVAEEFGRTCASIGILIAMATIIGESMLLSGAAAAIAGRMLRWAGAARAHWAFFGTSFLLCIPVMLDTVMYLLAPLYREVARRTGRDYLLLVMCTVAGGTITHSLVPPTPGPLFVAAELGVPLGLMIGMGSLIGMGAALTGVVYATWANARTPIPAPDFEARETPTTGPTEAELPLWLALAPIFVPILLIGMDAFFASLVGPSPDPWIRSLGVVVRVLGEKDMALTVGAMASLMPLAVSAGTRPAGETSKSVQAALASGGVILLIIGAGGSFGGVLQQTGIAQVLVKSIGGTEGLALPLIFVVTALVRTAQGSATVAMITAAPMAKAFIAAGAGVHPVYFAIAIGCGSKPFPWMNDAGFWVITNVSGLKESQTLRTIAPMMSLQGIAGLVLTMLCAWLLPLR